MQYIQLQSQLAEELDIPLEGGYNLFVDIADNYLKVKDSNGQLYGGGISLTEVTRTELQQLVESGSLVAGSYYKITNAASRSYLDSIGAGYNVVGNEIQDGGTTIILQAASDKTLSKRGIGLFYVPNYEDPQNPTAPPDFNYNTWDDTHRLTISNIVGIFEMNEYVQLNSAETANSTTAYLEGTTFGSGSGAITLRLENGDDHFFDDPNNLVSLTITGSYNSATGEIVGYDYISTYEPGTCVVFGGRVWQNTSGNIGQREGGWPSDALTLSSADWEVVPFDEVHYTLRADIIEYEFDKDNISYRSDGKNEVFSDYEYYGESWGYNSIKFFPWGHYGVDNVSFKNTYLYNFVNFPYDAEARTIEFKDGGGFDASTWGKQSSFERITAEKNADFGDNGFGNGTRIYSIKLGIGSFFGEITTCDNDYGDYSQIYEVTLGTEAGFGNFELYYGTYIEYVEIDTEAYVGDFTMYEYSRIRNVVAEMDSYLGSFTLWNSAEIKYVKLGINSYIENFNLYYSSCLKRTTLGSDSYIYNFSLGRDSFIRQVNLSERAYIYNLQLGDYGNFQNVDLGAYASVSTMYGGENTDYENIRIDAGASLYNIYLGYQSRFGEIEVAPDSQFYNLNSYNTPFSSSNVSGITIAPHSTIADINVGSGTYFQHIYLGANGLLGGITLEENASFQSINFKGNTESGMVTICSGSTISDFEVGLNSGFGGLTITGSASLTDFEIGNYCSFSGPTVTSSYSQKTISRGFTNLFDDMGDYIIPTTGSFVGIIDLTDIYTTQKGVITLDISDMPADSINYRLSFGYYEGQELKFVVKNSTPTVLPAPTDVRIWCDNLQYPIHLNYAGDGSNSSFAPFAHYDPLANGGTGDWVWRTIGRAVWTNGKWVTDAEFYFD